MTKSIFTGMGVVVMFVVIMAGLAGAYELTAPLAVAWLFLFVVFAILFAGFGGFKPFFSASDGGVASSLTEGQLTKDTSTRRLISVGAEVDDAQSLFGEREPISTDREAISTDREAISTDREAISTDNVSARTIRFDDAEDLADAELIPPRAPLFGEALSDQLDSERAEVIGEAGELDSTGIKWADDAIETSTDDAGETDESELVESVDEAEDETVGIVVDDDPDWVAADEESNEVASGETATESEDLDDDAHVELEEVELEEVAVEEAASVDEVDEVAVEADAEVLETEVLDDDLDNDIVEVEATEVVEVLEAGDDATDDASLEDSVDLEDIDAEKLAAALDSIEPADPSESSVEVDYVSEPVVTASTGLSVGSGTELPVVVQTPAPVELHKYSSSEIMAVVKTQEGHLVDTLIDEGVLSTQGPLTDKDIRTMVFVAVSSTELIEVLTEGQRDAVALNGGGNHELESGS